MAVRSCVVCTQLLNQASDEGTSRLQVDLHAMERLVLAMREIAGHDVTAICGKVGGYSQYEKVFGPLAAYPKSVVCEGRAESRYRIAGDAVAALGASLTNDAFRIRRKRTKNFFVLAIPSHFAADGRHIVSSDLAHGEYQAFHGVEIHLKATGSLVTCLIQELGADHTRAYGHHPYALVWSAPSS